MPGHVGFAFASALLILAAHVAAKAARDVIFLSHFPVTTLPIAMAAAAVVSLGCAIGVARVLGRRGPQGLVPGILIASAVLFVGERVLLDVAPRAGAVILYLHFAGLGAVIVSGFWAVINERFDSHAGRTEVARVGGFAAAGGVLGGLSAARVSSGLGIEEVLWGLALVQVGAAWLLGSVGSIEKPAKTGTERQSARAALQSEPMLRQMAVLVTVLAVMDAFLDYALRVGATEYYGTGDALAPFFAGFHTLSGLAGFFLQMGVGPWLLRKLGLGGAMALLPGAVAISAAAAAAIPRLAMVTASAGLSAALSNSVFRAGFELLYTPLAPEVKRPAKPYVDVGAQRLGDLIGAGLILALVALAEGMDVSGVLIGAALFSIGLGLVVHRLNRAYVSTLAERLRTGEVELDPGTSLDATTRGVHDTHLGLDRAEILGRIRDYERDRNIERGPETERRDAVDATLERIRDLHADDPERIRRALGARPADPGLCAHVIPLLERLDLLPDVSAWLGEVAPRVTGQLADALLDPERPVLVRRRMATVLAHAPGPRTIAALVAALDDPDFDVRVAAARAGVALRRRHPERRADETSVLAHAIAELRVEPWIWDQRGRRRTGAVDAESELLDDRELMVVPRNLEHVFSVLCLSYEVEPLRHALVGLFGGPKMHGTALEFLEATLPGELLAALQPALRQAVRA